MSTRVRLVLASAATLFGLMPIAGQAETVIEAWGKIESPPAPAVAPVSVAKAKTALLILDIEQATCNQQVRPRCVETVPGIASFLAKARSSGMMVAHSNTGRGSPETILPPAKPAAGEPVVKASVDKFLGTDLDAVLKAKQVDTVIVCGTAAHGAVLHTATAAAQRQYNIVLPVDCLSAEDLFTEKATVWVLLNGPATRQRTKATTLSTIGID
jgi:nicotinamidase-related amidase